jgi:hypothetical protein
LWIKDADFRDIPIRDRERASIKIIAQSGENSLGAAVFPAGAYAEARNLYVIFMPPADDPPRIFIPR